MINIDVKVMGLGSFDVNEQNRHLIRASLETFMNDRNKPRDMNDMVLCLELQGIWAEPVYVLQDNKNPKQFYIGWKRELDEELGEEPQRAIRSYN